jgi:uncharacterized protein (DUF2336 family)
MSDKTNLAAEDVAKLATDSSAAARAATAVKVAGQLAQTLTDSERRLAEDIIRAFMRDAVSGVRAALADSLKTNPDVPKDVALSLARDIAEVAVPFVQSSPALSDEDLLAIIQESAVRTQVAIAARPSVSETVSAALVDKGHEEVVATLVGNDGAQISEATLSTIVEQHGTAPSVATVMSTRAKMPVAIAERLVHRIFDELWSALASTQLPEDVVSDLILQARERATVALLPTDNARFDVDALVAHLHANKRLTPSIILRAVCMGDVRFLEAALAELADIPLENSRRLIEEGGSDGFRRLLQACKLPERLLPVLQAALEIAHDTQYDGGPNDRERYRNRVTERLLTMGDNLPDLPGQDVDYLIRHLTKTAA